MRNIQARWSPHRKTVLQIALHKITFNSSQSIPGVLMRPMQTWGTGAESESVTNRPENCQRSSVLREHRGLSLFKELNRLSISKCKETVYSVCSGLHVLPLFKGVWGRHPTPIDPAYYNSCGPAPYLSSECLSLLQRLQLNINPTTAGQAIKPRGLYFKEDNAAPQTKMRKETHIPMSARVKWSYRGNSAPVKKQELLF